MSDSAMDGTIDTPVSKINAGASFIELPAQTPKFILWNVAALGVALVAADSLLFDDRPGLNWVLFFCLLSGLQLVKQWKTLTRKQVVCGAVITVLSILPMAEAISFPAFLIGAGGTFLACNIFSGNLQGSPWNNVLNHLLAVCKSPLWYPYFLKKVFGGLVRKLTPYHWVGWVAPILIAAGFVYLFGLASPVWTSWLAGIDLSVLIDFIFTPRAFLLFFTGWLCVAFFIFPRAKRKFKIVKTFRNLDFTMKKASELGFAWRALLLVNIVFGLQSFADAAYLYGGLQLPDGMSYSSYVHRGTYPLTIAVMLAVAILLWTMRPNGAGERSRGIRWLVYLWIGQNSILLISAAARMKLYISAYSLTHLRLIVLMWLALVAVGLALVVWRFAREKSTNWLVGANFLALLVSFYVYAFLNVPDIVARYNLNQGKLAHQIDFYYLARLGENTLSAWMDYRKAHREFVPQRNVSISAAFSKLRFDTLKQARESNWRSWSFRGQRLEWKLQEWESIHKANSNPVVNVP